MSPKVPQGSRAFSVGLLAAALLAALATAWRDNSSALAGLLREQAPVAGLVWVRTEGQGRVIPPSVFIPLYLPAQRRMEIISVHATSPLSSGTRDTLGDVYSREYYSSEGDVVRASRAMADEAIRILGRSGSWPPGTPAPAFRLELKLASEGGTADLASFKERLIAWYGSPLFWLRFAHQLASMRGAPGLTRYDALLLGWALSRLEPRSIGLSLLPAPRLVAAFLAARLSPSPPPPPPGPVTAEILNSSGSGGAAMKATRVLRSQGIDVVHFGNSRSREASTRAIDRMGIPPAARSVMDALGCPPAEVLTEMQSDPKAAVTVILGQDFKRCSRLGD